MANDATADPVNGRRARGMLALLLGINLFNYIDRYVLSAVEPRIAKTFFHADDPNTLEKTGALATAFIVSYMIAAPIFGWLADRTSRWLLVGAGVLVWSLASGASGIATTFTMLLITRLFVGIGEAGYGPAAPTIIADLYPIERRGAVLAWFYMAIPVGYAALGYAWGGVADAMFHSWRWAFYLVVPPGILLAILSFMQPETKAHREAIQTRVETLRIHRAGEKQILFARLRRHDRDDFRDRRHLILDATLSGGISKSRRAVPRRRDIRNHQCYRRCLGNIARRHGG